jgi:hypothetical protein
MSTHRQYCVLYVGFILLMITRCFCEQCRNIALSSMQIKESSCKNYLDSIGLLSLFKEESTVYVSCQDLREAYVDNQHHKHSSRDGTYTCACWPGYTDNLSNGAHRGLVTLLSEFDIQNIKCSTTCPASYHNILKIIDESACSCLNQHGCVFQERTMTRDVAVRHSTSAVLVLPNDLLLDSSILYCNQFSMDYTVSLEEVLTCLQSNIEYQYYTKCESSCSDHENMLCVTNPSTGGCDISCRPGFFQMYQGDVQRRFCQAYPRCSKNTFLNSNFTCAPCEPDTYRTIIPVTLLHPNFNTFQQQEFCIACAAGKKTRGAGTDCSSTDKGSNTAVVVIPQVGGGSRCNANGFGWNSRNKICEICAQHHFSVATSNANDYILCTECALDEFTSDIGSTMCSPCPEFLFRQANSKTSECAVCAAGKSYSKDSMACEACVGHSINYQYGLSCSECSMLHVANLNKTACETCAVGKVRQQIYGFSRCEFCPTNFVLRGTACVRCDVPEISCEAGFFFDTCENTTLDSAPCMCGCRECYWQQQYEGSLENFQVLPGCIPSCKNGYKIIRPNSETVQCVDQNKLVRAHDTSNMKFSSTNSTDLTLHDCETFLRISNLDIFSILHMQPCEQSDPEIIYFEENVLINFISDPVEINDMNLNCFFGCTPGFSRAKSLGTDFLECVETVDSTCSHYQIEYETEECQEVWI